VIASVSAENTLFLHDRQNLTSPAFVLLWVEWFGGAEVGGGGGGGIGLEAMIFRVLA
jgi:hypothetical protein